MRKRTSVRAIAILVIATSGIAPVAAQTPNKIVKIETGKIAGTVSSNVLSFKGIPYAAPPTGNLRWHAPQPVKSWTGIRTATAYGNDCIQKPLPGDAAASGSKTSEDCLVLNVWRPAGNLSGKKLPVLVWIHGGGFLNGSSSASIYDGSAFARQGLVVVSFNYRLGRLGFFAHPALTAAREGQGNYGLLDQLAAMRWVQRNAAAFGGDPKQVTLMGESAGGISVMHHLISPEAKGLFQRAIVLSGGGRTYLVGGRKLSVRTPQQPSAEDSGVEFAKSVGITGTGADTLKALRRLPAQVVNGDMNMVALVTQPPTYAGGIIFDGSIVTTNPGEVLRRGGAANVPLLIGTTSQELAITYLLPKENPLSFFGTDVSQARSIYNPSGTLPSSEVLKSIGSDLAMHEPARFVAKQMTAAGNPAWLYRFGYVAESLRPKVTEAEHASEQPYLFNTLDARYGKAVTAKDREMARMFHTYFANFAKIGNPNGQNLPNWSKYNPSKPDLMMFLLKGESIMTADPWKERLDLVERVVESQTKAVRDLGGTSWQLVKFQSSDEKTLIPDRKAKYTIAFEANGQVSARFDCNRGRGTWKSLEPNQLQFGAIALTRALCPPDPLYGRIVKDWGMVRSYTLKDGNLFLSLMADGGIYEFEPISKTQPVAP